MKNINEIKELIEKYYAGNSSDEDDLVLRNYFSEHNIFDELKPYQPIFAYISEERKLLNKRNMQKNKPFFRSKFMRYGLAAMISAGIILTIGLFKTPKQIDNQCTGTFVIINGICYNNIELVKKYAVEAIDQITSLNHDIYDALDFIDEIDEKDFIINKK